MELEIILYFSLATILVVLPFCFFFWFLVEADHIIRWKKHNEKFRQCDIIRLCLAGIPSILFLIFFSPYCNWLNIFLLGSNNYRRIFCE